MSQPPKARRSLLCESQDEDISETQKLVEGSETESMDEDTCCPSCKYVESLVEKLTETQIQTSKELRLLRLEVCVEFQPDSYLSERIGSMSQHIEATLSR